MHVLQVCSCCGTEARCSRRDFSDQAWSVLVIWGEIEESVVDQSVCGGCYEELREILIDRAGEIEITLSNPEAYEQKVVAQKAGATSKPAKLDEKTQKKKEAKKAKPAAKKVVTAKKAKKAKRVSKLAS